MRVPKCPECGRELRLVWTETYQGYCLDEKTGRYAEDWSSSEEEVRCGECGVEVSTVLGAALREGLPGG